MLRRSRTVVLNLSNPAIAHAQQRANRAGASFFLMDNGLGGLDSVPTQLISVDEYGDRRTAVAVVHPQGGGAEADCVLAVRRYSRNGFLAKKELLEERVL